MFYLNEELNSDIKAILIWEKDAEFIECFLYLIKLCVSHCMYTGRCSGSRC